MFSFRIHQKVIARNPEIFKISCLTSVRALFFSSGAATPFVAGFGNRQTDQVYAYFICRYINTYLSLSFMTPFSFLSPPSRRYYDVTNPATMTSLTPLLRRQYPLSLYCSRYNAFTAPSNMPLLLPSTLLLLMSLLPPVIDDIRGRGGAT